MTPEGSHLAGFIEHTLLLPDAIETDVRLLCEEALHYQFAGVCIHSTWISFVAKLLENSPILPVSVVGFPFGATLTSAKAREAGLVAAAGARELDMVLNVGALKDKRYTLVCEDIAAVVKAASGRPIKVILECGLLSNEEKVTACKLCVDAGAAFVKTSTGFSKGGATVDDIRLMRQTVGALIGVKAAGGIRDLASARSMVDAGATRIGSSAGARIVTGRGDEDPR